MLSIRLLSSLHRVFPASCPEVSIRNLSTARNEPLSFQAAFRLEGESPKSIALNVRTESQLPLSTYLVGYVPVLHTDTDGFGPAPAPGLFPDMLLPKATNPALVRKEAPWGGRFIEQGEEITVYASNDSWQAFWFTLNEDGKDIKPGSYRVTVRLEAAEDRTVLAESSLTVRVLSIPLVPQTLVYTNWLHCDCLADFYGVEVFSNRFFRIFSDYVRAAVRNGMNMLLMPAFTPPLDTPIGHDRMTVQLVKIERTSGKYHFDFSLMKRFLDVAREAGIEYFEHSHLFSQWGAKAAPKIMASIDGREQQIFGWDTDAAGEAYKEFISAYLPAVTAFLTGEGLADKTLFHISDEPSEGMEESYAAARQTVGHLLDGFMVGDALSHYEYYEKGLVETPICATDCLDRFLGRCDHLWAYYTGGQFRNGLSNRILLCPPERNRVLGIELYANRIRGFLHWGYNYYYDFLSQGLYDPAMNAGGYNNHAGSCYAVYPGRQGKPIQSERQKVFGEGILDMRALQTLEALQGREACDSLLNKHFGQIDFHVTPENPEKILAFREELNNMLDPA